MPPYIILSFPEKIQLQAMDENKNLILDSRLCTSGRSNVKED